MTEEHGADERDAPSAGEDPGDAGIPQDAAELIAETADLEPPVEVVTVGARTEYRIGGRVFAVAEGAAFAADLGMEIATAALRTPDAAASPRGPGWVVLGAAHIDDHAADRIVSWFELARRIATGRRAPGDAHRA